MDDSLFDDIAVANGRLQFDEVKKYIPEAEHGRVFAFLVNSSRASFEAIQRWGDRLRVTPANN